MAQGSEAIPTGDSPLNVWLMRVHQAARQSVYTGTFVVSSGGNMASARIWHVCDGAQQLERVETLSGTPRAIFRRNDQVVTFFPLSKVAVAEVRESLGLFPSLLKSSDSSIGDFYRLKILGSERIAGFEAEIAQLIPHDRLRYGYRVWSEKKTGLIIQLQTLDLDGKVLEQAAFSELQLDAPVNVGKLSRLGSTDGYRVLRPELQKTSAEAQGWGLRKEVDGFRPMACYQRPVAGHAGAGVSPASAMQWIFSDGVATVSLFVEAFDARRHQREGVTDMGGATHTLTRRISDWWATVVGEVPPATLMAFAQALERKK
ncbi:MAG: MucB/RseB C-terminal domain-containing protein [Rhodoferax sp.]